jgi:hypothetical protein
MPERDYTLELPQPSAAELGITSTDWLAWRFNRLRCMSVAEIAHRLLRTLTTHAESWGLYGSARPVPADLTRCATAWVSVPAKIDRRAYLAAADRLLAGKFDIFALHDVDLGSPPRWNRDPKTGIEAPLSFGKLLDYRNQQRVGDIKYLWEPNRHMHLVTLAQAYVLSGEARYFEALRRHLEDWFVSCPYGRGPNWSSSLEAGIRLINWSFAWQLLGGAQAPVFEDEAGKRLRQRWLDSVYQHAKFIRSFFSCHSSANNHLIGEASGLFIAALTWPHWPESAGWCADAQAILEREALLQNAPDGVNREQSVSYQQHEIDLLLLPLLAARANGVNFSDAYRQNIERMLEYLASIMDVAGNAPMIGDSDDGLAVKLAQGSKYCRYRSSLATGAIVFQRGDFRIKARYLDDKTRWLLGPEADQQVPPRSAQQSLPVRQAFHEGGYYILGSDFETKEEIRLVADAGPLGYHGIAAHGHADALSFTLSIGGDEFLIDPGTYAYHTQGAWRQYFRGTSAHNTLRIDGEDQSQSGGNFMWIKKAVAGCSYWSSSAEEDVFEGWHDGYRRLADPVEHRRRITLDKTARRVLIEDRLQMNGEHMVELFFHCGEQCRVERNGDGYVIERGEHRLLLRLPEAGPSTLATQAFQASHRMLSGSVDPILGWVSRHFDVKQPTTTIAWSARLRGNAILRSEFHMPQTDYPSSSQTRRNLRKQSHSRQRSS